MFRGKSTCRALKEIRRQIAEANDIKYVVEECKYQGNCRGTCPKCEAEVRYLESELSKRRRLGKAVVVAGISMSVLTTPLWAKAEDKTPTSTPAPAHTEQNDTVATTDTLQCKYLITGVVRDNIDVIPGVSVRYKGGAYVTDMQGRFHIAVDELPVELKFNYIGYEPTTVTVNANNYQNLQVLMKEQSTRMTMGLGIPTESDKKIWKKLEKKEQKAEAKAERKAAKQKAKEEKKALREKRKAMKAAEKQMKAAQQEMEKLAKARIKAMEQDTREPVVPEIESPKMEKPEWRAIPLENETKKNSDTYNLKGQRVGKNAKGVVIRNGKKVLVK